MGEAFNNLSENSKDILTFIDEGVRRDYGLLVSTGASYENDAVFVNGLSQETATMAEELNASTEEISSVIMNIANNMSDSSENSDEILSGMTETLIALEQIVVSAENQALIAQRLNSLIHIFKL